jgi:FkbM family methyltransferase
VSIPPRARLVAVTLGFVALGVAVFVPGSKLRAEYTLNRSCCALPRHVALFLSAKELLGLVSFPSQIGQDKWVSEGVFPGVTDGYFVDVGSADGKLDSNTYALERKGWKGICIDPFPTNMERRTCQMFKEVVYSERGKTVTFHTAGQLGGVADSIKSTKNLVESSPTVEFATVTLDDILERAQAPRNIQFMSLDIEGAELLALQGLSLDKYRFGAFAIEHNNETEKRDAIQTLLARHGYQRVHSFAQDDFYVPVQVTAAK